MHAEESIASQPAAEKPHLVDLQHEEIESHRTAVLNRELVRMRADGWTVQRVGDHLDARRNEAGRSQLERSLLVVLGFLAVAYVATLAVPDQIASLPVSKSLFLGAAVLLGLAAAFVTRAQAGATRHVTVSMDGQGRAFTVERGRDL